MGTKAGVDRIIRAAYHIVHVRARKDVHFALLGDGECRPALQQLARSLQLEPCLSWPGFVADQQLLAWLSTADVCLAADPPNAANELSTSTKLMEYMSCGKPTVCFDLAEARYSAGSAAVYVQRDDSALFGDAILELLDDSARRQRMIQAGLDRVRQQLNWDHSRRDLLEAYRHLTGAPLQLVRAGEEKRAA